MVPNKLANELTNQVGQLLQHLGSHRDGSRIGREAPLSDDHPREFEGDVDIGRFQLTAVDGQILNLIGGTGIRIIHLIRKAAAAIA